MSKTTKLALLTVCIVIALSCVFGACSPTKYTLTFDTVGGEMEGETTVLFKEGAKIEPATPQKGNFTFEGWYADAAYSQKFENFAKMPAQDVTVYAKWSTYTSGKINFESNGGSQVASVRGVTGLPVDAPANPTKDGYKFVGWCQDEALTNLYTFSTYPNGEITLYAKWQQSTSQFAYVTFDLNGVKTEVAVQKGQPIEKPTSQLGQTCTWYTDSNKLVAYNFDSIIISNTTLYGDLCTEGLVVKGNTVTEYNGTEEHVFVPQTNNGVAVTTIASNVFADNTSITSVHLPATLQNIGDHAFYNCEYLETINLTSAVKNIGGYAFSGCVRLDCELDLTGLTTIANNVFANCKMLTSINLADNLTQICAYAFADCKALAQINLPNSVTTVGEYAFANTALTSLNIPDALTSLGEGAVKGCKIASVTVANNAIFTVVDNAVYANNGRMLLLQFGTVEHLALPSTLETVATWAFDGATVKSMDLSALNVSAVQQGALRGIVGLQSLKVSNFNQDNKFLAYWFGAVLAIDNTTQSLYVPTTLTKVEFTVAQTVVPDYAFFGCQSLQTIVGFEQATQIGPYAYAYTGVTNIELSTQTTDVHATAFAGANNLQLTLADQHPTYSMFDGALYSKDLSKLLFVPSGKTEINFAEQMLSIETQAFTGSNVKEVVVPNTIETIKFGAFYEVVALEKLTVPFIGGGTSNSLYMLYIFGSQVTFDSQSGNLSISGDTYPRTLREITLSNPVTEIPDVAFVYCKGLAVLNNDADLTSIGNFAFFKTAFEVVDIADTVTKIGYFAYAQSDRINQITIGKGVTEIGQQAFAMLPSLQVVTFEEGENDLVIGAEAFIGSYYEGSRGYEGRSYLEEINFSNNIVSIGEMAFGFAGAYGTDVEDYAELKITFDVQNSRLKSLAFMAFAYSAVTEVVLPASIETIGEVAFFSCQTLTKVRFGSSTHEVSNLTVIGDGAFAGCFSLTTVYLYKTVTDASQVPVLGLKTNEMTKDYSVFYSSDPTIYVPKSSLEIYQQVWAEEGLNLKGTGR